MPILADLIDVCGVLAIPVGIVIGLLIAWKMGAIRQGYEKGKEASERWTGRKP